MRLKGKTAIITGSSSGIGRATALLYAAEGANVVINARGSGPTGTGAIDQVVKQIRSAGGNAIGVPGAVDDPAFADDIVARCIDAFGKIDILVNNAAIYSGEAIGPVHLCSIGEWNRTLRVNLDGMFHVARAALPHMIAQRWGRIVNAGSFAGTGRMGGSAYSISKAGVFGLTRAMAADYGPYGITVNCYNPEALGDMGNANDRSVYLGMIRQWEEKGFRTRSESNYLIDLGGPDGVAPWLTYLCTDDASYLNGRVFAVEARRVAMHKEMDEERLLFRDALQTGPWSLDELAALAPLAFPVENRWPRREGEALARWEAA
jgi:NAD(P)-dependent dehydrogenase (short-subunit alcohol dehydrogenase family)